MEFKIYNNKEKNISFIIIKDKNLYQTYKMDYDMFDFIFEAFNQADEKMKLKVLNTWAEKTHEKNNIKKPLIMCDNINYIVKEIRKRCRLTQPNLGYILGYARSTIAKYETQKTPHIKYLFLISIIAGITVDEVISGDISQLDIDINRNLFFDKHKIIDNMKKIRKKKKISQQALAEKLGLTADTLSNYETGKTFPEIDILINFVNVFKITLNELLTK